jgi:hypothetical protein
METANVVILYFFPDSKFGNGISVFKQWETNKNDEKTFLFSKYLVNWVAGTKLIFITLLIVILFTADEITKLFSIFVMILSISTYYIKLHPIIKKLDLLNEISPKGYSKSLLLMISGFLIIFIFSIIIYLYKYY